MVLQFFSRNTVWVLGGLATAHLLAFFCLHQQAPSLIVLSLAAIGLAMLTARHLEWGLALAFLEVIVGGHGHLFAVTVGGFTVSLRMMMFLIVLGVWSIRMFQRRVHLHILPWRDSPFLLLMGAVATGVIVGFFHGNPLAAWFDDANSYATLVYLFPLMSVTWTNEMRGLFLRTLGVGALWITLATLLLLYSFTHLPQEGIWTLYTFVRDSRLFEITLLSGPAVLTQWLGNSPWYFRVFGQGQFYVFIVMLLMFVAQFRVTHAWRPVFVFNTFFLAAALATLSRSFLLGFAVASVTLGGYVLHSLWCEGVRRHYHTRVVTLSRLCGAGVLAVALLWILVVIPLPARPDLLHSPFYKGQSDDTRNLAVSSRWNLLPPLMNAIHEHPVWGSGFGKEVTYISDDPRLRAQNPTGEYTTYRFEWGFHDIWLKMGMLGVFSAFVVLGVFLYRAWSAYRNALATAWLSVGMSLGVIFLFTTHIFSPFINHPIGLFFLLIAAFVIDPYVPQALSQQQPTEAFSDMHLATSASA